MSRIYLITTRDLANDAADLVRADSRSQAIRAIAERDLCCEVADQETLIVLTARGVKVVDARTPQQELAEEGGGLNNE